MPSRIIVTSVRSIRPPKNCGVGSQLIYNRDSKLPPKKVFYLPNRGDRTRLPFETDVPLWPGSNLIQVFARETNEVQTVQTMVVLQRGATSLVKAPEPEGRNARP